MMRRLRLLPALATLFISPTPNVSADPVFVNGLPIDAGTLDRMKGEGANGGRLGFFSDLCRASPPP